jgi:hypothetical protein
MTQKNLDEVKSVRLDSEKIKLAYSLEIDCAQVFRDALDQAIINAKGKCPTCGQKVKSK